MKHSYCEGCTHLSNKINEHCYMFKEIPKSTCMQHTELKRTEVRSIDVFTGYLLKMNL